MISLSIGVPSQPHASLIRRKNSTSVSPSFSGCMKPCTRTVLPSSSRTSFGSSIPGRYSNPPRTVNEVGTGSEPRAHKRRAPRQRRRDDTVRKCSAVAPGTTPRTPSLTPARSGGHTPPPYPRPMPNSKTKNVRKKHHKAIKARKRKEKEQRAQAQKDGGKDKKA